MKNKIQALAFAASIALFATTTRAFAEGNIYVGVPLGIASVSKGGGTHFTIGAEAGYKLLPNISLGGFFNYVSLSSGSITAGTVTVTGAGSNLYMLGGEGTYHLSSILENLRLAAKVGLAIVSSPGTSASNFMIGPKVGYDYAFPGGLSVGPSVEWMYVAASSTFSVFSVVGEIRYSF